MWNNGASASSPSRRGQIWRSCEAAGGWCPQIRRSGGVSCSGGGRCGEDGDRPLELLSLSLVFVMVRWLLALLWRFWGCGEIWSWCRWLVRLVACTEAFVHGGSSPLLLPGGGGDKASVVRHLSASSSCGCAIAEVDDFPLADAGCCPRSGRRGCGGAGALTARLRPVSMCSQRWVSRDRNVFLLFLGVLCTADSF